MKAEQQKDSGVAFLDWKHGGTDTVCADSVDEAAEFCRRVNGEAVLEALGDAEKQMLSRVMDSFAVLEIKAIIRAVAAKYRGGS
jgi:hypothetical protein